MRLKLPHSELELRIGRDSRGRRLWIVGPDLPPAPPPDDRPDWVQASPVKIRRALERARALPSGGWYVLDASRRIGRRPRFFRVEGQEMVAWRHDGELRVGPNGCPHMGAPLSTGRVDERDGHLICPWHGLRLLEDRGRFKPLESHDDGLLSWVRLERDDLSTSTSTPILPPRPEGPIAGSIRMIVKADPDDVIANRLDPWHGAHFHPHSFARLRVIGDDDDKLTVRVAFRVGGPLCFEVDATFHCADPRTIVMTIVDGEGVGSTVETHATPIAPGLSAVVELILATSDREGFRYARSVASLVRPMINATARRLWVEDAAYAERTCSVRRGSPPEPGGRRSSWELPPGTPYRR